MLTSWDIQVPPPTSTLPRFESAKTEAEEAMIREAVMSGHGGFLLLWKGGNQYGKLLVWVGGLGF